MYDMYMICMFVCLYVCLYVYIISVDKKIPLDDEVSLMGYSMRTPQFRYTLWVHFNRVTMLPGRAIFGLLCIYNYLRLLMLYIYIYK